MVYIVCVCETSELNFNQSMNQSISLFAHKKQHKIKSEKTSNKSKTYQGSV